MNTRNPKKKKKNYGAIITVTPGGSAKRSKDWKKRSVSIGKQRECIHGRKRWIKVEKSHARVTTKILYYNNNKNYDCGQSQNKSRLVIKMKDLAAGNQLTWYGWFIITWQWWDRRTCRDHSQTQLTPRTQPREWSEPLEECLQKAWMHTSGISSEVCWFPKDKTLQWLTTSTEKCTSP